MTWKQILKISLLALTLAACEEQDNFKIEQEQPVHYEVNERIAAPSNKVATKEATQTNQVEVKYLWTSDGDTAVFETKTTEGNGIKNRKGEKVKVRFLLIDSPEMKDKKTRNPQPYAEAATARTKEVLESANKITIETDVGDKYDRYDRLLAYVYADGQSVQEILLKEGLAKVAYVFPPNTRYLEEYKAAEATAIKKGVGLWK